MTRRMRTFVVWLLFLALPLQSFAAASGAACACMHSAMESARAMATSDSDAVQQQDGEMPCHSTEKADHPCDSEAQDHDKSSCGVCASCCVVHAALPVMFDFADTADLPVPAIATLPSLSTDYIAPTPERPPRHHSA